MQRAGKLIRGLKLGGEGLSPADCARAAWPHAVGARIAVHARAVECRDSLLIVEVEDAIWRHQLYTMRSQILRRLADVAGKDCVRSIEFRIGVPRRAPQRAQSLLASPDEADGIADPILRRNYRASRKKFAG